jgi:hypothetical protein
MITFDDVYLKRVARNQGIATSKVLRLEHITHIESVGLWRLSVDASVLAKQIHSQPTKVTYSYMFTTKKGMNQAKDRRKAIKRDEFR